ncbi:MAG: AEC family transporter [Eubacteriales bacterium]|nr:AEC family transporter [Eubacteriales bacterium]MDD4421592.1 AEC family transporter [Eubacteriales bacterium]
MPFSTTAFNVLIMLAYAIPGFILIKTKSVKQEAISAFAMFLLFVCQPCLSVYSFNTADYTPELGISLLIFFFASLILQVLMLFVVYLIFKRKYKENPEYRICTVASVLGNTGFFGVPLLQALLPEYPNAIVFSAVFIVGMNLISWTLSSALLTGDKKYMSLKKILLNPVMLTLIISLPLFLTRTKLPGTGADNEALPGTLSYIIALLGKMTTPISMLILGMRLGLTKVRDLFMDLKVYIVAFFKLIAFPLVGMAAAYTLPLEPYIKATLIILFCCPTASTVLNFSELFGTGQKTAAKLVLTSTLFCVITIPVLLTFIKV